MENLQEQLECVEKQFKLEREREYELWKRECKEKAFKMALQNKPQTNYGGIGAPNVSYTTDQLIKDANKIYEELIK